MGYIDRDAVYREACKGCTCHGDEVGSCYSPEPCGKLTSAFAAAPDADVEPVVRCKDCAKSGVTEFGRRYCKEPLGMYGCVPVKDDGFCNFGRRRGENDG